MHVGISSSARWVRAAALAEWAEPGEIRRLAAASLPQGARRRLSRRGRVADRGAPRAAPHRRWALPLLVMALAGCHSRSSVRFSNDGPAGVVMVETVERQNFLVSNTVERAFWVCVEGKEAYRCTMRCGPGTEYRCPRGLFLHHQVAPRLR